jgi:hypothetical protein
MKGKVVGEIRDTSFPGGGGTERERRYVRRFPGFARLS